MSKRTQISINTFVIIMLKKESNFTVIKIKYFTVQSASLNTMITCIKQKSSILKSLEIQLNKL